MSLTGKELASLNLSRGDSTDNLLGMTDDRDVLLSPSVADCETSALIEPDPPPVMPLADDCQTAAAGIDADASAASAVGQQQFEEEDELEGETDEPQPLADPSAASTQNSTASQRRKTHAANKQQSIATGQSSRPLLTAPSFDQRPAPNLAESPWSSTETSYQRSRKNSQVNLLDSQFFSGSGK